MKWSRGYRSGLVLAGFSAAILMGEASANADFTIGIPTKVSNVNISSVEVANPEISSDGLTLYFSPGPSAGYGSSDIWMSTREATDEDWSVPVNLGPPINSSACEDQPSISADGLELYFADGSYSTQGPYRPGGYGGSDLWVSRRATTNDSWGEPVNLGPIVNSSASESDPEISADGLSLFFQSDCPGGYGYPDLWVTRRLSKDSPWEKPVNLGPTLNAGHYDGDPEISPDGLSLFLCIYGRVGGYGGVDLWVSRRATPHDPWADPVNLGPIVNGAFGDSDPSISADGSVLYFSSNRSGLWEIWQAPIGPIVDFNGDGTVDGFEVKAMANHWGTDDTLYDIGPMPWGDGIVDAHDLIALAKYIGAEVDDPTLVAHWRLDETDGTTVCDSIGSHHGMVIGVPVWWPEGGRVDGALELSGMTFIMASFVLNPADGPFSVLAWVKGGQPGQGIIAQQGGVDWLHVDAAQGNLTTELSRSLCSQIVITDGNWHRVGVTWDGSACQLYVDDVLEAESTEGELASSTDGIVIGCRKTVAGTFFTGLIDDVRIYNRAVKP